MKTQTCKLCFREIDLSKENYVQLIDFKEGKFFMEGFFHTNCYTQKITQHSKTMDKARGILDKAGRMLGFKDETIVDIK